jgi:putative hydroxymethylpyrimidine transport system substrate-binding protein
LNRGEGWLASVFLVPVVLAAGLILSAAPARAADKLTLVLDWFINPDHGPIVVADQMGLFRDAGLEVELVEPADPNDPPKLVAAGKADLAVTYQPQLHLQVAEGLPLVRVATLVDTPLNALVVLRDGPVKTLADLKGKKIGFSIGGFEDALLTTMLGTAGLSLRDVQLVNVNFSLSPALIAGQVDAVIGAYRNFELNQMDLVDHPGRAFYVEDHGVPMYDELVVVANRKDIAKPAIARFVQVLNRAAQQIADHPDDSWKAFAGAKGDLDDNLNRLAWRDTLPRFARHPAALDTARYAAFADYLKKQGLIRETPPVDTYAIEIKP